MKSALPLKAHSHGLASQPLEVGKIFPGQKLGWIQDYSTRCNLIVNNIITMSLLQKRIADSSWVTNVHNHQYNKVYTGCHALISSGGNVLVKFQ